ncbi:MAG: anthranilate phosphoribosyltransferase [candidate division KSB1 bacterium]|nr:anthranilate phosphoribosyltransferase [candidate division KSB1 bacterium]
MRELLAKALDGEALSEKEAACAVHKIMDGEATPAQIGAFLAALRVRGETVDEIVGAARAMREKALRVPVQVEAIDTCGTGGDGVGSFNISTVAAFVAAGAGVPVAKHGNRSVSSRCGSADLLERLGINLELGPEQVGRCVDEVGIGFLFAPLLHRAMKHALGPRREIGARTIFNLLGPLTNPAFVKRQVLGVYSAGRVRDVALALQRLGVQRALVVHGDGMDEIALSGPTAVAELDGNSLREYTVEPEDFGFRRVPREELAGGDPDRNAEIALAALEGVPGPCLDAVLLNAGAAIWIGGLAQSWQEGIERAKEAVASGKARAKVDELREFTRCVP